MVARLGSQWRLCDPHCRARLMNGPANLLRSDFWFITIVSLIALGIAPLQHAWGARANPSITLTVDEESIYLGDSLIIEMEVVGIEDSVDITPLLEGADLLRETQGTRIAVIDQHVVEVRIRRMELLPKQEGRLIIGPVQGENTAGSIESNSLEVVVLPAITERWYPDATDLHVSMTLTDGISSKPVPSSAPYTTYIGQRIIADIELRHRYPVIDEEIALPDFEGFDVLAGYEQRRTVETDNANQSSDSNKQRVIAWRYHLFAQQSGQLSIDEVLWQGTTVRSRTQRAKFSKRIPARDVQIEPAAQGVKWWLPASALSLQDSWSSDVRKLSAGDEIIRTITLDADNVLASHLPDVQPLQSRAFSSTLIDQSRSQQLAGDQIQSSATFTYRMLAESPIPVFLDTVRVSWYNTTQSELREAIIPARRINIGLPERADLLAALALNDRWTERLALEVRSVASRFAYWHISLLVLGLIACVMAVREIQLLLRNRYEDKTQDSLPLL